MPLNTATGRNGGTTPLAGQPPEYAPAIRLEVRSGPAGLWRDVHARNAERIRDSVSDFSFFSDAKQCKRVLLDAWIHSLRYK